MAADTRRFHDRDSVEFARVLTFSDGMFAIAMTLLVVGIEVPDIPDTESVRDLADALGDLIPSMVSFLISFLVIGRYWLAHHQFFSLLKGMTLTLIAANLNYLLFIAFLPFPTGLLGNFFENPLAFAIYAVAAACVSGMEVVLLRIAHRGEMLTRPLPDNVYRWGLIQSTFPVGSFLASIPVAFLVDPSWAVLIWFLGVPIQIICRRWTPDQADELLGGL